MIVGGLVLALGHRHGQVETTSRSQDPVDLGHALSWKLDVLEDLRAEDRVEPVVGEGHPVQRCDMVHR